LSTPKLLLIEPPFRSAVSSYQPMVVGISAKSANFASAVQVARIVKEVSPHIRVVMGGPHHPS
jgi:hypothetical protein